MRWPFWRGGRCRRGDRCSEVAVVERWPFWRGDRCRRGDRCSEVAVVEEVTVVERWPLWRGGRYREVTVVERWPLEEVRLYVTESPKVKKKDPGYSLSPVIINLRDKRLISISLLAMGETDKQSATKNLVFIRKKTGFVNLQGRLDLQKDCCL